MGYYPRMDSYYQWIKDYTIDEKDLEKSFLFFEFKLFNEMKNVHGFCNSMANKIQGKNICIHDLEKKIKILEKQNEKLKKETIFYLQIIDAMQRRCQRTRYLKRFWGSDRT